MDAEDRGGEGADAMILTEAEAGIKWCPASRWSVSSVGKGVYAGGWNRPADHSRCIASTCMAWRWAKEQPGGDRVGYCGLVNK